MCHVGEESRLSTEEEEEKDALLQGARVASGSQRDVPSVRSQAAAGGPEQIICWWR